VVLANVQCPSLHALFGLRWKYQIFPAAEQVFSSYP
jgi:hypothetical protein